MVPCLTLIALCLGLPGCALFGKKQPAPAAGAPDPLLPRTDPNPGASPDKKASAAAPTNPVVQTSTGNGLLAGKVIDSFSRSPAEAYILVSCPKQDGQSEKKPIDVAADSQGYFTITGLKPGRHYQLQARARDGNRMLAGSTWAMAPNTRVLILISEDFVTKNTPPIPPPPVWPGLKDREQKTAARLDQPRAIQPKDADRIATGPDSRRGQIHVTPPEPKNETDINNDGGFERTPAAPPVKVAPDRIAESGNPDVKKGPVVKTPPIGPEPAPQWTPPTPPTTKSDGWSPPSVAPANRVPMCVLAGKQLVNFALYDLDNKPWEFRNRTGRLVLLDFWGTKCMPCRQAIPHLKILQNQYRAAGLQVIGIAYEDGGTANEQRRLVDMICQRLQINYKVLMGGQKCPVKTDFGVRYLPTMVLLDQNGWIIYSHEGLPSADDWVDLEQKIQRWLGAK
jgi:thiol-disulfide isomerase/thioredoxin